MYRAARAAIVEPAGTAGGASMISKLSWKKMTRRFFAAAGCRAYGAIGATPPA
jgi:hypothetical protein